MQYDEESKHNMEIFLSALKDLRPDIWVLGDMLDKTKVNYKVLFQVIRHLHHLGEGNKYGTVTVQVENGVVTFVRGEESTKVSEPLIDEDSIYSQRISVDNTKQS